MRLSDIMSAMHLESYAEVALIIFFVVFVAIAIRVLRDRSGRMDEAARIPLDSDPDAEPSNFQRARRQSTHRDEHRRRVDGHQESDDQGHDRREDRQELQFGGQA